MHIPGAAESARRVSGCVTELLRKQPFFGSLALRLPLRADPSRKTLASDGREIRYDPGWVADTGAHLVETAIARVVLACALKHHTRRGERDPERWQRASQLVTHALLREAGFTLPPDADEIEGISVEEAYERLPPPDGNGPDADPPPPEGGGTPGAGDGEFDPSGDTDGKDPQDEPAGGEGSQDDQTGSDAGSESSGVPSSHDPAGTGEIMDAPSGTDDQAEQDDKADAGTGPADHTAEEQAWDEAMHQAANLARAEGKLPGAVAETVQGAHASRLDWRALLRRYLTDAARSDYSWSAPNMRFIDSGLYLPSIRSEGMDELAVIIDTSGSLPTETLGEFWTELREIVQEIQPERVIVLQVDTAVRDDAEHSAFDLPGEIEARGRGGTDFRPGFDWLAERGIQPSACLYFTDMECSDYPDAEPPFPVLWINWSDPPEDEYLEPWGERIDIGSPRY